MEKVNFKDYLWNIYELCSKNPAAADLGVAYDMFRNNVKLGRAEDGGTVVAWNLLKERWDAMSKEEQERSRKEYHMCDSASGLWDAFKAGDRAEFERIKDETFAASQAALAEAEAEAE